MLTRRAFPVDKPVNASRVTLGSPRPVLLSQGGLQADLCCATQTHCPGTDHGTGVLQAAPTERLHLADDTDLLFIYQYNKRLSREHCFCLTAEILALLLSKKML